MGVHHPVPVNIQELNPHRVAFKSKRCNHLFFPPSVHLRRTIESPRNQFAQRRIPRLLTVIHIRHPQVIKHIRRQFDFRIQRQIQCMTPVDTRSQYSRLTPVVPDIHIVYHRMRNSQKLLPERMFPQCRRQVPKRTHIPFPSQSTIRIKRRNSFIGVSDRIRQNQIHNIRREIPAFP